jgi:hypothetical protein
VVFAPHSTSGFGRAAGTFFASNGTVMGFIKVNDAVAPMRAGCLPAAGDLTLPGASGR